MNVTTPALSFGKSGCGLCSAASASCQIELLVGVEASGWETRLRSFGASCCGSLAAFMFVCVGANTDTHSFTLSLFHSVTFSLSLSLSLALALALALARSLALSLSLSLSPSLSLPMSINLSPLSSRDLGLLRF